MKTKNLAYLCIAVLAVVVMTACGSGGNGGGSISTDPTPTSNPTVTSDPTTTTVVPDTTAPSVPTGFTVTAISTSEISLSWTASTDNVGVFAYKIYKNGVFWNAVNTTSTSDTGLAASTQYCYTVTAQDLATNESAQTTQVCATTQAVVVIPPADTTAPTVPTGFTVTTISTSEISLSWTASTDNVAVTGYKIYRGGSYLKAVSTSTTSDTGLTANTQYCYAVSAYDSANNESARTTQVCATIQTAVDPNAWKLPVGAQAKATVVDSAGNLYVAGIISGAFPGFTSAGGDDAFLVKMNQDGTIAWAHQLGTAYNENVSYWSLTVNNADEAFFYWVESGQYTSYISTFNGNGFVATFTAPLYTNGIVADNNVLYITTKDGHIVCANKTTGSVTWDKTVVLSGITDFRHITFKDGYVFAVGETDGPVSGYVNAGLSDIIVVKLTTSGTLVWAKQWGTADVESGYGIVVTSSAVYVGGVTGYIAGTPHNIFRGYDLDGNFLWHTDATQLSGNPHNLVTDSTSLWVSGYSIVRMSTDGIIQKSVSSLASSIALYGNTFFVTDNTNVIKRYDKDLNKM